MVAMIEGGQYGTSRRSGTAGSKRKSSSTTSRPSYQGSSLSLAQKTGIPAAQSIVRPAYRAPSNPTSSNKNNSAPTAPRIQSNPIGQISATSVQPAAVAPPPAPSVPTEDEWLGGDTAYQSQMAALQKALADYRSQSNQQQTQYGVDYSSKLNELGLAEKQGIKDLENDFASRGLLQSGLFDNNRIELGSMFDRREGDLARAKADFEANLATALANFETENNLTGTRARQEALARRAAQFGL